MQKINELLKEEITKVITYELQNPKIQGFISVTDVDTTNNLEYANVKLSIFAYGNKDEKAEEEIFNNILHSAGYIRQKVCEAVDLQKMPYLQFELDRGQQYANEVNELLNKIKGNK